MCLIIANPTCAQVPTEYILNAYSQNSDGFGIMFPKNGNLMVKRGMFTVGHILNIFDALHASGQPYVAHFRYATHGTTNGRNCHPFPINTHLGGVAMVHNGTLLGSEWRSPTKSDTALLAGHIQKHIEHKTFRTKDLFEKDVPVVHDRYGKALGSDKLVFMNGKGEMNIYNEENGLWVDDVWFSNLYSICTPKVRYNSWSRGASRETTTEKRPVEATIAPKTEQE